MVRNSRYGPVRGYVLCFERLNRCTGTCSNDLAAADDYGARVEEKFSCRILKRACAAKVVDAVLLQKSANFSGAIRCDFRRGEPALDFGSEMRKLRIFGNQPTKLQELVLGKPFFGDQVKVLHVEI